MKVVCDEGVPRPLVRQLRQFGLDIAPQPPEWRGLTNGRLIAAAVSGGFEVLLSNDKNMVHQHNLLHLQISVVTLPTNDMSLLQQRSADVAATLLGVVHRQFIAIGWDGSRVRRQIGPDGIVLTDFMPPLDPFGAS